jgi:hypothetical protein
MATALLRQHRPARPAYAVLGLRTRSKRRRPSDCGCDDGPTCWIHFAALQPSEIMALRIGDALSSTAWTATNAMFQPIQNWSGTSAPTSPRSVSPRMAVCSATYEESRTSTPRKTRSGTLQETPLSPLPRSSHPWPSTHRFAVCHSLNVAEHRGGGRTGRGMGRAQREDAAGCLYGVPGRPGRSRDGTDRDTTGPRRLSGSGSPDREPHVHPAATVSPHAPRPKAAGPLVPTMISSDIARGCGPTKINNGAA